MLTALLFLLMLPTPQLAGEKGRTTLRGNLGVSGGASVLEGEGKRVPLTSRDKNIAASLGDSRLAGRELHIVGQFGPDGAFDVAELHVVRRAALYRLIYFCDVCNITTFSPGDCACCQQPLQPIEVLPTDPRVYQEQLGAPSEKP